MTTQTLRTRRLGDGGPEVTVVGLGTNNFGPRIDFEQARSVVDAREISDDRWQSVEALQRFAEERGVSLLDVAIGGLAAMRPVVSVIAGATKPEQVRANASAGAWEPTEDDLAELKALR